MDLAVGIDGWVADSTLSVIVGNPADEDRRLVRATEQALEAAIQAARPGNRLGDVSVPSARSRTTTATRSTPTSVVTESGGPCTRLRTFPTPAAPVVASGCDRA
jgi:methionine aminopeptidase